MPSRLLGRPWLPGDSIEFRVKVIYLRSLTNHGPIVLVFQDEKDRSAKRSGAQVRLRVDKPAGEVALSDRVAIPVDANELRLSVSSQESATD
jgi:hypothetical protein